MGYWTLKRMAASFSYGRLDGRMVHVRDLQPSTRRGLQCGCVCPECGRQLQAHMGSQKAWHFQHHVEDANCNPQPMSLLHAFVRDELAKRGELAVPQVQAFIHLDVDGKRLTKAVALPERSFRYTAAQTEARTGSIQPDVSFLTDDGTAVALEVRYTHAVDDHKQTTLRGRFAWAAEFNVSDLPPDGVSVAQLETLLTQPDRWKWLANPFLSQAERLELARHRWRNTLWRAGADIRAIPNARHANQKLKTAQQRLEWAKGALHELRGWVVHEEDAADWLGERDRFERVAVACAALRIEPVSLPDFLTQRLAPSVPEHVFRASPHRWQPLVFSKFCIGRRAFSAHDAAKWCRRAMPELCSADDGSRCANGFSWTAAALHVYFLQLEAQGLLQGAPNVPREERTFTPRFASVRELHAHLSALRVREAPATLEQRLAALRRAHGSKARA